MTTEEQLFAITLNVGSSLANETGSWRTERPVYVSLLSPYNKAHPAGENIQRWPYHAEEGGYQAAWRKIMVNNPVPATMGQVCYHPCQSAYDRMQVDEITGINAIEHFLGGKAIEQGWRAPALAPDSGKSVLIVGAGSSGLSVTYHLRLTGHRVHIKEAEPMAGDMVRFDVLPYRLPRGILDAEIRRIEEMGVSIEYNAKVENVENEFSKWDVIFLAVDAHIGRHIDIPAGESAKIVNVASLLQGVEKGESPMLGREVVVYGGGDTAVGVARMVKRLGVLETIIIYRRTRDRTSVHDFEVAEAEEEGIMIRWLSTVKHMDGGTLTVEKMELDDPGSPQPIGEFKELGTDSLTMTLGQEADLSLIGNTSGIGIEDGVVKVNDQMTTSIEGVLAGGDTAPSERTATVAIDYGKKASRYTDAHLRDTAYTPAPRHVGAEFSRMTLRYYANAPCQARAKLEDARHVSTFDEAVQRLDGELALFEARRCMSCGNCSGCDNCFGVRPDSTIMKITPSEYELKYNYYKGYGLCVEECPCGTISVVPEQV